MVLLLFLLGLLAIGRIVGPLFCLTLLVFSLLGSDALQLLLRTQAPLCCVERCLLRFTPTIQRPPLGSNLINTGLYCESALARLLLLLKRRLCQRTIRRDRLALRLVSRSGLCNRRIQGQAQNQQATQT
jgi:hypothetical protein